MGKVKNNWIRPWNEVKFDNISEKDERFFAIVIKGLLSYLTKNIMLYNKHINHYILSTGTLYLYVEMNDYEFSWNTTTGESTLYSKLPRCTVDVGTFTLAKEDLSAPYSRGLYERQENDTLYSFEAEIRRLPILIEFTLHYSLSNFNESIILIEELFNDLLWEKYYNVNYLGQLIECSIEFPDMAQILYNKVDFSVESKLKTIDINLIVKTSYPLINQRSEIRNDRVIRAFRADTTTFKYPQYDTESYYYEEFPEPYDYKDWMKKGKTPIRDIKLQEEKDNE